MDGNSVAVLHRSTDLVDVGEVDFRIDALCMQIQPQCDQVDVARPLAVAEQASLDALRAGQHCQFGARNAGAAVVVRVDREDHRIASGQILVHVFDLIGIDVGGGDFDCGRQVVDDRAIGTGVPEFGETVADLQDVVGFGEVEDLG